MAKKIMVVEDDPMIGTTIADKLEYNGYDVVGVANDDEQAREILKNVTPDLLLMDINLNAPIDGIELVTELHRDYDIPVVYITGYSDNATIARSIQTSPYGYISKPFTTQELLVTVSLSFVRIELEKHLNEKNILLSGVLDNISDGIAVIDENDIITICNMSFCRITGEHDNPCGFPIRDVLRGYRNSAEPYMLNVSFGPAKRRVLTSVSSLFNGHIITLADLTETETFKTALNTAENNFAIIFKKKVVPSVIVSYPDGTISDTNEAFEKLYHIGREAVGELAELLFGAETMAGIMAFLSVQDSFDIRRTELKDVNGSMFYADIKGNKIFLDKGAYFLMDIVDVSEMVRIEKIEHEMKMKMIQTSKMAALGTLVSGVAHELNNPNNFIMFNTTLLMDYYNDVVALLDSLNEQGLVMKIGRQDYEEAKNDIKQLLAGTVNGSERIRDIVSDLKGFARQGTNSDLEPVSPKEIVNSALRILRHRISKTTDHFTADIEPDIPEIMGCRQKLEQVLINIIMNSLEAMTAKSQKLTISCRKSGVNVIVEISDEGSGIPENVLMRITEPFFTTKQSTGGTGLGLSIAYSIMRDHKGTLDVQSVENEGTTVTLTIPAV